MKNIFYIFKSAFIVSLLLQVSFLQGQDIEIECPGGTCGLPIAGIYTDSGMTENGQTIYSGPDGASTYALKCEGEMLAPGLTVYRWEIQMMSGGDLLYFDDAISNFPFAFSGSNNNWTSENSANNPAPTSVSAAVLPVELSYFKATSNGKVVDLTWQTATELNNAGFEIERSGDNREWTQLDFIAGWGTSYEAENYSYVDESPLAGVNYYRLKQKDYDGAFAYSFVVKAEYQSAAVRIYPNPVTAGQITIRMPDEQEANSTVEIYDRLGRLVQTNFLTYGQSQVDISELPFGVYLLRLEQNGRSHNERLIIK